ncbi:MAG: AlpA family transcriptional regulator [Burkholderiales bacterium]|nr:AlpA family transcriptional regulator [Burkholderiales bacterium]
MSKRIIRCSEVLSRTGMSKSRMYEGIAKGDFPAPVQIGERAVGWVEGEVDVWIASKVAARDREQAAKRAAEHGAATRDV